MRIIQNDQQQDPNQDFPQDQSKRMVTIRRINVPHAEPQVTVTAKGISPDKDKLLYTFINGQLIPSANVPTTPPLVTGTNDTSAKSKMNAKSSEPVANSKTAKKQTETVLPDKTAKKNAKEKPIEKNSKLNDKNNVRKTSPENSKPSTTKPTKSTATANAIANPSTTLKEKDKQKQKKGGKKDLDQEVESITNATKELAIADEKPKKEKKKEKKAIKFEYADPNYKVNQFDLLDMDEDDGYYIESSDDDSSDDEPPVTRPSVVIQPTPAVHKPNPPLSNQSSVESQSAQSNARANNKTQATATSAATTKNVKAAETTKKGKNETNTKTQLQKNDRKSSTDSTATTSTKSLKSQPQNQTHQPSAPVTVGKQSIATADDSNLSKKQKKKLDKKQTSSQAQQQQQLPNATRTASRAVCPKFSFNTFDRFTFSKQKFNFPNVCFYRILISMQ